MNKRFIGLITFALAISGIASLLVYRLLASRLTNNTSAAAQTQVLVASRDIKVGVLLRPEDVKLTVWQGQVPNEALTAVEKADGRATMIALHAGEMVLENILTPKGAGAGLAVKIPAGMRAVA